MHNTTQKLVTVIAPCFNEGKVLAAFWEKLAAVAASLPDYAFEFLFVNDGSTDNTEELLLKQGEMDDRVKVVSLSRNFGHQRAITAGLDFAGGDYCIIIDADLQDPPELIPEILEQLEAGFDLVHTVRSDRRVDSWAKRLSAGLFYRFMKHWVLPELPENAGDYKGFNRTVLKALQQYRERVRFLRGAFATLGFSQCSVSYVRATRHAGDSKYPFWQMLRFARDAIVSNSTLPLRMGAYAGILSVLLGCCYAVFCLGLVLLSQCSIDHVIVALLLLLGGAVLMMLGAIGEYLKCIVLEVKQRPLYIVRSTHNIAPRE